MPSAPDRSAGNEPDADGAGSRGSETAELSLVGLGSQCGRRGAATANLACEEELVKGTRSSKDQGAASKWPEKIASASHEEGQMPEK